MTDAAASGATRELRFATALPPHELSANGREAPRALWAARALYREEVRIDALQAKHGARWEWVRTIGYRKDGRPIQKWKPEVCPMAEVSITFGVKLVNGRSDGKYRPLDVGNAVYAFKAGFDGLVDAGILPDDDFRNMQLGRVIIDPARAGVLVVVKLV